MKIHNFKELLVWQKAMSLAKFVYLFTKSFPTEEKYGLTSQIQRSAVSIPSNIAEGTGRISKKEFKHFLSVAMGSAFELETQVLLASEFSFVSKEQVAEFENRISEIQKMIFGLYKSLNE